MKTWQTSISVDLVTRRCTHSEAFSVKYSRTSCSLAEGGNCRSWGTWLQAEQFSCQTKQEHEGTSSLKPHHTLIALCVNSTVSYINTVLLNKMGKYISIKDSHLVTSKTWLTFRSASKGVGVQSVHNIKYQIIIQWNISAAKSEKGNMNDT